MGLTPILTYFVISKLSMWLSGLMAVRTLSTGGSDSEALGRWAATLVSHNDD